MIMGLGVTRGTGKMAVVVGDGGRVRRESESHRRDSKGKYCTVVVEVVVPSGGGRDQWRWGSPEVVVTGGGR
jgi:hypothetical protein